MKCRFIDSGFNSAYWNMSVDEAILNFCEIPTLRVYQWMPSAISIGYSQNPQKELNMAQCKKNNIEIVRRITGGKSVFHENDITYSFFVPETASLLPRDITESYKIIANALRLAFKKIGINAKIRKQPCKIETPLCFNSINWYELTVNRKKISGSAQKRIKGKVLQHGPLLIDFDYEKNFEIFISRNGFGSTENLKKQITSIKNELNKSISYEELADAIKHGFQKNFDFDFFDDSLSNEELMLASSLEKSKYSTKQWNFGGKNNGI